MIKKFKIQNSKFKINEKGQLSLFVLIFSAVAMIILSGLIVWVDSNQKVVYRTTYQHSALMVAEAGVEYYRWHLAHAPNDFQDGTGHVGPYTHNYYDKNNALIGQYTLDITPPPLSSSLVTIKSTGKLDGVPNVQRVIQARLGIPSVVKYAVLANSNIRFEPGTLVFGPIHANGGIRFDGTAYNIVTSARTTYNDPDHSGADEYAIHTHTGSVDPLPPAALPLRADVFTSGRQFPVPAVDFAGLTQTLAQIKKSAQSAGKYFAASGSNGYHIILKIDGTFDIYKVKKMAKRPNVNCRNKLHQKKWKTWSISAAGGSEQLVGNYPIPANGLIFVEDNIWVDGKINKSKLTIASGKFPYSPNKATSIIINKSITYTNYDGQDVIGLIAQRNINVGMVSDNTLRIDAAVVAQNGSVQRYYYRPPSGGKNYCTAAYSSPSSFTLNGMIATNSGYGFAYTDGSGYQNRTIIYDSNLLYNPPPSFPLISGYYQQVSWKELE